MNITSSRALSNRSLKCFAAASLLLAIALLQFKSLAHSETSKSTFEELKAKAEAGDAAAQYQFGLHYARGDGAAKNYVEGLKWVRKSAEQDYAEAEWYLGNSYFGGRGLDRDYDLAFQWVQKAAKQGIVDAEATLGVCYEFGHGVDKNLAEANEWYRKAAQLNNAIAQNNLGAAMIQGRGIGRDVIQAYKWILLAGAQGNKTALENVNRYERTLTAEQLAQAKALAEAFRSADLSASKESLPPLPTAAQSSAVAQNASPPPVPQMGSGNTLGVGQLPTPPPMSNYPSEGQQSTSGSLQERAEAGDPQAQCDLGIAYTAGNGVPKNFSQAVKWFRKSAEQNNAAAQYNLGVAYAQGLGGAHKSMVEAFKWYRNSAEQNYADAQYNLGCAYLFGQGVRKNGGEAFKWFGKASEQDVVDAQANLGYCYMNGIGVQRDDIQAYKWSALAAARGNEKAREYLGTLNSRMSRAAISQGQQLAKEFAPNQGGTEPAPNPEQPQPPQTGALRPHNTGTGFFITEDGYLITNNHVVQGGAAVQLISRHAKVVATVVEVDPANDLALLKAEGEYTALPIGSSFDVKLGDTVSTIGFPLIDLQGVSPKFTRGEISSLAGFKDDVRYFQMSTQIQPGNSGGALVDEHGNVIGVTSATLTAGALFKSRGVMPENVNYAIKSYLVADFLKWALRKSPGKLKPPNADQEKPSGLIDRMKEAAVLVVVYVHGS